jgi:RNA polymerase sigma factor (sigma-70 family)
MQNRFGRRDGELVSQCLRGDAGAWKALVTRYENLIYSVARVHFRESAAADDVFQDVCTELYRRLETIEDIQALPKWLITVTRRKSRQAMTRAEWSDMDPSDIATSDQQVTAVEHRFWIEQALGQLSDREQKLIEALYLDPAQPTYLQISERLDMPVASIGPTRARCLKKLRQHWEGTA